MQNNKKQYRQGDVWIERVDRIPEGTEPVKPENGRLILARGEATGHHHSIDAKFGALLAKGAERFLKVEKTVQLKHQEHDPIQLPAGDYIVSIQREYHPEDVRNVLD